MREKMKKKGREQSRISVVENLKKLGKLQNIDYQAVLKRGTIQNELKHLLFT